MGQGAAKVVEAQHSLSLDVRLTLVPLLTTNRHTMAEELSMLVDVVCQWHALMRNAYDSESLQSK